MLGAIYRSFNRDATKKLQHMSETADSAAAHVLRKNCSSSEEDAKMQMQLRALSPTRC